MKLMIREKILLFVKANPGKTAWEVARGIDAQTGSVSSIIRTMALNGELHRSKNHSKRVARGWEYFIARSTE